MLLSLLVLAVITVMTLPTLIRRRNVRESIVAAAITAVTMLYAYTFLTNEPMPAVLPAADAFIEEKIGLSYEKWGL